MIVAATADRIVILGGWRPQSLALGDPFRGCGDCPRQPPRMACDDAVNAELSRTMVSQSTHPGDEATGTIWMRQDPEFRDHFWMRQHDRPTALSLNTRTGIE